MWFPASPRFSNTKRKDALLNLIHEQTGEKHVLNSSVFTVGSGSINNLVVRAEHVRKIHFQILKQGHHYRLIALNGTAEVNGQSVSEYTLTHGDKIQIGSENYLVDDPEPITTALPVVAVRDEPPDSAVEALLEGVISLLENPDKRKSTEDILTLGLNLMESDGGFLFTVDEQGGLRLLHSIPEDNELYSHSAVKAVLQSGETVVWSVSDDLEETSLHSLQHKNIHSILVAPLKNRHTGKIGGLVYLHRRRSENPFNDTQRRLFGRIGRVLGAILGINQQHLRQEEQIRSLKDVKGSGDMIYASPQMARVVDAAARVATSHVPVLILGEPGTGKDVLANAIHKRSTRQAGPFIAVNCSAIPEHLIESELFGHERGAFSTAAGLKKGLFEQADGGTLFLDEVGALPLLMQVKFLRSLQNGRIRRVGGVEDLAVDVRIIAATHLNLEDEVRRGHFREDLFYRLNLFQLHLPPLRDREGDVLLLANHILKKACTAFNMNLATLTKSAEKALLKYHWPGNVRELENKIQKSLLNSSSRVIDAETLDLPLEAAPELISLKAVREQAELHAIQTAMTKARGNLTLAASFLGIDRKVLRDIMDRLGIKKEEYKPHRMG
jgi:transcriptional regulator with GAF, ATPase, and Fis domain